MIGERLADLAPNGSGDRPPQAMERSGGRPAEGVAARLQAVAQMDRGTLREEWRRLFRSHPPRRVARGMLALGVAWKIQEKAHGGLSAALRRRLVELANTIEQDGDLSQSRVARLRPGAKLVREWRNKTHTVLVIEDGFEWRGKRWRSLTTIAREITGAHWSGPRFFGLHRTAKTDVAVEAGGNGDVAKATHAQG